MDAVQMRHRLAAEFTGTLFLVLIGCGTAVLAGRAAGVIGVALAFGLAVVVGAYAFGHVSGAHFNPAITLGAAAAGRMQWKDVPGYVVAQLFGGTAGAAILLAIAHGHSGFDPVQSGFATNGYGDRSPAGYAMWSVILTETVMTAIFVTIFLAVTSKRAFAGFGGLAVGLTLTAIHLVSIPVSNTSVNPARSLGVAWFAGWDALQQQWVFVLAPILGALIAGFLHELVVGGETEKELA